MAQSIKLKDENYIDSTGIVHNQKTLDTYLDKSLICVRLNANTTFTSNIQKIITYNEIVKQIGNNITMISNGQFKVSKDMCVKFSFYNNFQPYVAKQFFMYRIFVNDEQKAQYGYEGGDQWGNTGSTGANFVLDVKMNDIITLQIYTENANCTLRAHSYCTLEEF